MVEKLTKNILFKVITEIKKDDNQQKIEEEILNPILFKFLNKIYPYIKIASLLFIIHFLLIIIILILLIFFNKKSIIINNTND